MNRRPRRRAEISKRQRPSRTAAVTATCLLHSAVDGRRRGSDSVDPARVSEVAHETAAVIVKTGRAARDPELKSTLVALVTRAPVPC